MQNSKPTTGSSFDMSIIEENTTHSVSAAQLPHPTYVPKKAIESEIVDANLTSQVNRNSKFETRTKKRSVTTNDRLNILLGFSKDHEEHDEENCEIRHALTIKRV